MLIALIWWRVKDSDAAVDQFFAHWKTLGIDDLTGLIGEFLSEPAPMGDFELPGGRLVPVSDLVPADPRCRIFVNVGLWESKEAFEAEVAPKIKEGGDLAPWQYAPTTRSLLTPKSWRIGDSLVSVLPRDHYWERAAEC